MAPWQEEQQMSLDESREISLPDLGRVHYVGNANLLREPRAAILNSRHGKFPAANSPWIQTTLELCHKLTQEGYVVVSSVGMSTWELVTWKVGACGGKLIIVVTDQERKDAAEIARCITDDFALDFSKTLFLFPDNAPQLQETLEGLPKRDRWIIALTEVIFPVAIRAQGNLARILEILMDSSARRVETRLAVPYEKTKRRVWHFPAEIIEANAPEFQWDYLTHWTRATASLWPGETKAEFYASFEACETGYPRGGLQTLRRILRERRIRASKQLVRGEQEVVSLTACPPWELAKLMKWRPSMFRWTFEPYGIALNRAKLKSLGARAVIYGEDYQYRFLQEGDKPFFQSCGSEKNDWRNEKEWRHVGDLELSQFTSEDAIVLTLTQEEANLLQNESPFPVVSWADIPKKLTRRNIESGAIS
jgi:hypothetical protein